MMSSGVPRARWTVQHKIGVGSRFRSSRARVEQNSAKDRHFPVAISHWGSSVGGGYAAWLLIPFVFSSELDGHVKGIVVAALSAMPLATKILAIALLGRPSLNYLKKRYGLFGGLTGRER
jgi:hypothetical protein